MNERKTQNAIRNTQNARLQTTCNVGQAKRNTYCVSRITYHVLPNLGFTLIELLVVISLIGILSAIGLASYLNFNRNQLVVQSTRKIVQDLRLAQSLAANNQKPSSNCSTLNSYIFKRIDETRYGIDVECLNPPNPPNVSSVKSGNIPSGILMSGFDQVKFKVLRQGIESVGVGNSSLMISGFGKSKEIVVEEGGVIRVEGE